MLLAAMMLGRNVEPASIVPTIAALLGIQPPAGARAAVLREVLDR
jgi:hypothetical protein